MKIARRPMLLLTIAFLACTDDGPGAPSLDDAIDGSAPLDGQVEVDGRARYDGAPSTPRVCTPGADQTCNDNPEISSLHGACEADGSCTCKPEYEKNPATGRCL